MNRSESTARAPWFPLTAFILFAVCVFAMGLVYYHNLVTVSRAETLEMLAAIADLKIMQIVNWREERFRDAQLLASDPFFNQRVRAALSGTDGGAAGDDMVAILQRSRTTYDLNNLLVFDSRGKQRFAAIAGSLPGPDHADFSCTLQTGGPVWGDLVRDPRSGEIYLDILLPLQAGLLVVRIDPQKSLFPLIQAWPTKSATAETLLVRRSGDEVMYLNELRHRHNTALQFMVSAQEKDMPAARAARGELDGTSGIDYRGRQVLYTAKQVPDTAWLMITKIDEAEILSRMRLLAAVTGLGFILSMMAVGIFLFLHLRLRRSFDLRREQDLQSATRDLNLRMRELNCLYGISSAVEHYGSSLPDILKRVVDLLPQAWEHPEITCARITVDDRQYPTQFCQETQWRQSADIIVQGQVRGRVEIFYLEDRAPAEKHPGAGLPASFIAEVAERIALNVQRLTALEALQESFAQIQRLNAELEKKVSDRTAQLQQTLDTLRESEERYRTVADFTCDWEFWLSPENKYLFISPSFENMTGYPAQALYDDAGFLETIVHPDDRDFIIPHMQANAPADGAPIDFRIITRAGEERWISHVCQQVFAPDGRYLGRRGSNRDITETKRFRDEAIRDAHLASIGRLAAGMAHEINNPVSGIINYAEIIRKKCPLEDKYREYLDDLIAEGERIATIVKDLLLFARPNFGQPEPAGCYDIYCRTFSLFAKQLEKHFVKVTARFPADLPRVLVRPQQIQQVILNIFSNALYALDKKFPDTDPAKVLEVAAEQVAQAGGAFVRLTFQDNGIGIPANMLPRVCDPFFSTKPAGEGTGLGLNIAHTIMKDHGGRLVVDSRQGEYTKITLEFPAMQEGQ